MDLALLIQEQIFEIGSCAEYFGVFASDEDDFDRGDVVDGWEDLPELGCHSLGDGVEGRVFVEPDGGNLPLYYHTEGLQLIEGRRCAADGLA